MATGATIDRPTIDRLAVRVCHAVRDVRGEHRAWIAVAQIADHLDSESPDAIDRVIERGEPERARKYVDFLMELEGRDHPAVLAAEARLAGR